jgi:glutathione S-transferase
LRACSQADALSFRRASQRAEEGDLALFETGAIIFHIAEHHAGLFPEDANARARPAYQRAFAAQWAVNAGSPQAGR